jgi:glucokinase
MKTYVGIDIGGTNIRFGLVTDEGKVLSDSHFSVFSERGLEAVLNDLTNNLTTFLSTLPEDLKPQGVGVGAAGRILPAEGLIVSSPNLPGWKNVPLAEHLQKTVDLEVRLENDVNVYALGEWLAGAGRGSENLVVLTLGTGVGGGLILNNRLWSGSFGTAAEIGHMVVEPDGPPCKCGSRGCLETFASATAMVNMAKEMINGGRECGYEGRLENLTSAHLFDLAIEGDSLALDIFSSAGTAIGITLTNVFNLLGLQGAIIGGGAGLTFEFLKPSIEKELSSRVFAVDYDQIFLARSTLGDMAPLIGAPALFR